MLDFVIQPAMMAVSRLTRFAVNNAFIWSDAEAVEPEQKPVGASKSRLNSDTFIVGLLFSSPTSKLAKDEILPNLEYFHHRSGDLADFLCVGYSSSQIEVSSSPLSQVVATVNSRNWHFSPADFNKSRAEVESHTRWRFSGETDLLLVTAQPISMSETVPQYVLDFSSAIACNLEQMIRDGAIQSARGFFEKIFQLIETQQSSDSVMSLSDKFGIVAGGKLLEESILSLLPIVVRKRYNSTKHFAVCNVSK
jgi:hypothetical protein